jgi:hypothetical protein
MGSFTTLKMADFWTGLRSDGAEHERIELHEADYESENKFYRPVDIPFAEQLRKVRVHHPFPCAPRRQQ